jgi:hypothetical protein
MGAKLSVEQEASLEKFRACVVVLLQTGMENTTIPTTNISMKRMRECLNQVSSLSMFMLVIFSRRWSEAINPLMEHGVPTIDTLDDYLHRFSKVSLRLPMNGSAKDVCNVMATLHVDLKMQMVTMLLTSMMHIQQARLPPESPTETESPLPIVSSSKSTSPSPTPVEPATPIESLTPTDEHRSQSPSIDTEPSAQLVAAEPEPAEPSNSQYLHICDIPHEVLQQHLPPNRVPYQMYTFKIDDYLFSVTDV